MKKLTLTLAFLAALPGASMAQEFNPFAPFRMLLEDLDRSIQRRDRGRQPRYESERPQAPSHIPDPETVPFALNFNPGEIIVSFGDRRLYYVTVPGQAVSYPIAIPRPEDRWQGVEKVTDKKVNPPWRPTPDMIAERPELPEYVPGGHPMNPMGVRAIYLGKTLYRIHGTDNPASIGTAASKGCIRMLNEHVIDLYNRTNMGAKVTVTYERFAPNLNSYRG